VTRRDRHIRNASLRLIEAEIRNYHQTVQDLRELEESIALPGQGEFGNGTRSTEPGDPTPARAYKMMTSAQLLEIRGVWMPLSTCCGCSRLARSRGGMN
jgi:hypothetical protein